MIDKQAVALINRELDLKWDGRYRLVWANDQFEIRGERGERMLKYSYLKNQFILEKFFGRAAFTVPDEVKDWNGWEVIWAFESKHDPNLTVCMFLADALENGVKQSLKDHFDADKKKFDKEVQEAYDILENESPYLATMLKNREAIVVPEIKNAERLRNSGDDS